jgi:hypothetical protein
MILSPHFNPSRARRRALDRVGARIRPRTHGRIDVARFVDPLVRIATNPAARPLGIRADRAALDAPGLP